MYEGIRELILNNIVYPSWNEYITHIIVFISIVIGISVLILLTTWIIKIKRKRLEILPKKSSDLEKSNE